MRDFALPLREDVSVPELLLFRFTPPFFEIGFFLYLRRSFGITGSGSLASSSGWNSTRVHALIASPRLQNPSSSPSRPCSAKSPRLRCSGLSARTRTAVELGRDTGVPALSALRPHLGAERSIQLRLPLSTRQSTLLSSSSLSSLSAGREHRTLRLGGNAETRPETCIGLLLTQTSPSLTGWWSALAG